MPVLFLPRQSTALLSPALPVRNDTLLSAGVVLRQGQFSLVASGPGVGKSLFATNMAVRTPADTLFLSADSDEWTVTTRVCSILTGNQLETVESHLNEEGSPWPGFYGKYLSQSEHVDWCYNTRIDVEFILDRMKAYEELRGYMPKLLVVDNLKNTVEDMDKQYAELEGICYDLQEIARIEQCHVMALHHVKGAKEGGREPIYLDDLLGNLGKVPEIVLGLNRLGDTSINMTIPKNRGGRSGHNLALPIDYTTATIGGFQL